MEKKNEITSVKKRIAILISGRGSNMNAIIKNTQEGILKELCEIVLVFSNKPDSKGLTTAKEAGIETQSLVSKGKKRAAFDEDVVQLLAPYQLDYIVLAGYMRILSPFFIEAYKNKIINIHPADTHLHKGLHAYEWAFEQKMEETCITVHFVDEGVDTGNILEQKTVDLRGVEKLEEVETRGLKVEHQFYSEVLAKVFKGIYQKV